LTSINLEIIIANNITLTAPVAPGMAWNAQVWMFENAFMAEHENPYQAVSMVVRELKKNGLIKESGELEDDTYATHLVEEELIADENEFHINQEQEQLQQEELKRRAGFYSDQFSPGEDGYCDPESVTWSEVEDYPLEKLLCVEMPSRERWTGWLKNEIEMFLKDGMDGLAEIYRSMVNENIENHIVVIEINGKGYIWDGNHRVAASFAGGKSTIRALVGIPN